VVPTATAQGGRRLDRPRHGGSWSHCLYDDPKALPEKRSVLRDPAASRHDPTTPDAGQTRRRADPTLRDLQPAPNSDGAGLPGPGAQPTPKDPPCDPTTPDAGQTRRRADPILEDPQPAPNSDGAFLPGPGVPPTPKDPRCGLSSDGADHPGQGARLIPVPGASTPPIARAYRHLARDEVDRALAWRSMLPG